MLEFIYIVLGIFDAAAALFFILKLYMLPVREYLARIILFCIGIAVFSYFMRVVLDIPTFDLPVQYLLFILFLRIGLKIKVHLASFITGAGICAYTEIQMGLYYLYRWAGLINVEVLKEDVGVHLYIFQISFICLTYIAALLLTKFNLGFSFIIKPPHDFLVREDYWSDRNLVLALGSLTSLLTISITLLFLYSANPLGLLLVAAVTFALSFYFSGRSDRDDIRKFIEAYRHKNKGS